MPPFGPNPIDQITYKVISRQTPLHRRTDPVYPTTEVGKHPDRSKQAGNLFSILRQTASHATQFGIDSTPFTPELLQSSDSVITHAAHHPHVFGLCRRPSGTTSLQPRRQSVFSERNRRSTNTPQTLRPSSVWLRDRTPARFRASKSPQRQKTVRRSEGAAEIGGG